MKHVLALAVGMSVLAAPAFAQEEPVLNIYNWSDYIAEDTIPNFEQQTGIKVNYDVFDSNEVLEAKLLTGNSGYDIVVPTNNFLERQIQAGIYMPLDKSKLPNLKNMDPTIMKTLSISDAGNEHAIPYMWGTTGFGYSAKAIAERMPDAPTDSWDMIFNPDVVSKFADCGVTMLDAPSEVMSAALHYLGIDPLSEDPGDLQKATDLVMKVRPYIRYFHSSQYISDLANGDICLSLGWSGDVFIAQSRAADADNGVDVQYVIPKEGAQVWIDNMAIPKDAPHPDNAYKFLNYIMEPAVVAAISDYVYYANGNAASFPLIDKAITSDPAIYPPDDVKAKLYAIKAHSPSYDRLLTRA
jgi:putrescine transport system substrate-binding protein